MAHHPLPSQSVGFDLPAGLPTLATVTASATPHAKGAWATVVASTPAQVRGLWVWITTATFVNAADSRMAFDVGIGAAGSETMIVEGVLCGHKDNPANSYYLPIELPAGVRVAVRAQSVTASKVVSMRAMCVMTEPGQYSSRDHLGMATTYGFDPATTNGMLPAAPASANAYGAWTQIIAATTERCNAMMVSIQGQTGSTNIGVAQGVIDIGMGAVGQEAIVAQIPFETLSNEVVGQLFRCHAEAMLEAEVPLGQRLSARIWSTVTSANARPTVAVHTFRR